MGTFGLFCLSELERSVNETSPVTSDLWSLYRKRQALPLRFRIDKARRNHRLAVEVREFRKNGASVNRRLRKPPARSMCGREPFMRNGVVGVAKMPRI